MDQRHDKMFRSLMDLEGPQPLEGDNPFFTEVPVVELDIYEIDCWPEDIFLAKKMARRFCHMLSKVKMLIIEQSARENGGTAQFVEGVMTDAVTGCTRCSYKIPTTAVSGFFALLLRPIGRKGLLGKPVKFIFSLSNLYLAGFIHEEVFYHYEDAILDGIEVTEENHKYIVRMPMDGGYTGTEAGVLIGLGGLWQTYYTLIHAVQRTRDEVQLALFRVFACVSEAERFPAWAIRLYKIFVHNMNVPIDCPPDEPKKFYSWNFNQWDRICYAVALGPSRFITSVAGYGQFEILLRQSSVLLFSAVHEARQQIQEEAEQKLREERTARGIYRQYRWS